MYARVKETSGLRPWRRLGLISLSGLIGLGALASCSSEQSEELQEPSVTETAIAFTADEQQDQMITRSTGLEKEGVRTFKVWGYKNTGSSFEGVQAVFPGYTVNWQDNTATTTTTNSNSWEYVNDEQTIKYWDWSASAYRFFAVTGEKTSYVAYEANGTYGTNEANKTCEFTFTADCSGDTNEAIEANMADAPYFTHLWFSTGDPATYPNQQFGKPVQLEFLKPFARVRFMFTYSYQSEGIKIRSTEFMPTDDYGKEENDRIKIATAGTFKVIYPLNGTKTSEWFESTNFTAYIDQFDKEYIPDGGEDKEIWYTVLPRSSQSSFTMYVRMNNDNEAIPQKTAVVPAEYMTWLPGYSYTYIFKITEEGGVEIELVQSAVTPWTPATADHSVYNW
ncbi:MAG: hypothetical protein J5797_03415 [Prevotella sp.]|nr:hypothetical protein [Prevotella sp.]